MGWTYLTYWFAVSGNNPTTCPVQLDDSNNNFLALYVLAATVGALLFIVLVITFIHKCVRPIPPITSLVPCISNNNNRGAYEGEEVRRLHFPGNFSQLVVDNIENPVIGVDVMVRAN